MYPIARPRIVKLQSFVNDERESPFVRYLDCKVERIVMTCALEHLHPVEDVSAFCVFVGVVEFGDPA